MISHGNFEEEILDSIASAISAAFPYGINIEEIRMDMSEFYDPVRRQYDGNSILREIDALFTDQYIKQVALFRVDLFIPILTYIFGQATLNGKTAISSIYRFRNEQYGMQKDEELLIDRFKKVVIHEFGHTFGLIHCHNSTCIMRSSTYVEDLDQKEMGFCYNCKTKLDAKINGYQT